ncbi:hypothetical protein SDC9_145172 [bioreactor metagenome]|uniref:Alpha-L-rhamnosidase six-hairpin glycosidase domain-containing protein n=1 Tax=bioreactor metagenome TaxID=1076179 RepID=A0A645E982_9ZZZZ
MTRIQHDARSRFYCAAVRVVLAENCDQSEALPGSMTIQPDFSRNRKSCRLHPGGFVLLDFGRELAGGIRIVTGTSMNPQHRVRLRFGESVSECCGQPDNDHGIHDGIYLVANFGATEIGNTGFRFIRIDLPPDAETPLELIGVAAVLLMHDLPHAGSFQSSDERLNLIWKTGVYTVQLNLQDYVYDGIKRDRLVWPGDLHPELRVAAAVFDDLTLFAKTMDFARDTTPLPETMCDISSYSLWWIICQHDY